MITKVSSLQSNQAKVNTEVDLKSNDKILKNEELINSKDTFVKETSFSETTTYSPPKKLTAEQVNDINRAREESTLAMVSDVIRQTVQNQANGANINYNGFEIRSDTASLLTDIFGSLESALPAPATTPEGALENISEGGAYSVEAVSGRIMQMATYFAAGNQDVLAEMEEAVKKGFEAAGLNLETGEGMPSITMETYEHVMSEFDKLYAEYV